MSERILVVDDEKGMQLALREVLVRQNYEVTVAGDGMTAVKRLEEQSYDLVITDIRMPEMSGMELLDRIRTRWPQVPSLVITAHGTIEDAVEAMKKGAVDYLLKPFSSETIEHTVRRLLAGARENKLPGDATSSEAQAGVEPTRLNGANPIAVSDRTRQVLDLARQVADSVATILIQGESGTGKEVLARFIHAQSDRRDGPFVAVNCAALPENLLESELFGHEKGAFTGAVLSRKGKFELANHGTLLLDEVSEMPLPLQAKLLRVLQEREIDPIGAQKPVPLDVRIIATTNRDLGRHVEEDQFREDLFYRLQVITLSMPPLRQRKEDIAPLSDYFVRRHCRMNRRPRKKLSSAMQHYLLEQHWRGNVRELENFLERAVLLCQTDEITPDNIFLDSHLSSAPINDAPKPSLAALPAGEQSQQSATQSASGPRPFMPGPGEMMTLEEMEKRLILQTLDQVDGNRTKAADMLGVSVRTIRNKLNAYGLSGRSPEQAMQATAS